MHGLFWFLHKDHHQPNGGKIEKNDIFFLLFAIPSWLLIENGMKAGNDWRLYAGIGVLAYGLAYFAIHEVYIHKRLNWFKNSSNPYLRALRKAHYTHHKLQQKSGGSCFGMLLFPPKFFK